VEKAGKETLLEAGGQTSKASELAVVLRTVLEVYQKKMGERRTMAETEETQRREMVTAESREETELGTAQALQEVKAAQ